MEKLLFVGKFVFE